MVNWDVIGLQCASRISYVLLEGAFFLKDDYDETETTSTTCRGKIGKTVRCVLGFVGALIESPSEGLATARGWSPYIDWWLDDRSPWKVFEIDTHYAIIFVSHPQLFGKADRKKHNSCCTAMVPSLS